MPTRLILVRHGAVSYSGRVGGADDSLNTLGELQTQALARRLAERNIAAIYTSPLRRAAHTSEILAQFLGAPVREDARLLEFDAGESRETFRKRALAAADEIVFSHTGQEAVAVSHSDTISALIAHFLGLEIRQPAGPSPSTTAASPSWSSNATQPSYAPSTTPRTWKASRCDSYPGESAAPSVCHPDRPDGPSGSALPNCHPDRSAAEWRDLSQHNLRLSGRPGPARTHAPETRPSHLPPSTSLLPPSSFLLPSPSSSLPFSVSPVLFPP